MKTILIPIDFSAHSHDTAHFGLELAHRIQARVVLLHVVQPAPPVPSFGIPVVELSDWNDSLHRQMTNALQYYQNKLDEYKRQRGLGSIPIATRLVVGQAVDSILEVANAERAHFVVMGTVGASSPWDKLIGSVTSSVAQRADRPLWIIPSAVKLDSIQRLAYFADMEGNELSCINQVMNLGERLRAALDVVHVSSFTDEEQEDHFLDAIVDSFEDSYAPERLTFHHLTAESTSQGIESYVRTHWPDAIVLAHRNRSFVENLFHPSLIRYLSLTTKRPMLVIPKPG